MVPQSVDFFKFLNVITKVYIYSYQRSGTLIMRSNFGFVIVGSSPTPVYSFFSIFFLTADNC